MNCAGDGFRHLFGALERHVASHANGEIGKVAVAGAANADPVHFEQTIHGRDRGENLVANAVGSGIEQGVNCLAGQAPAYVDDHAGHEKCSDRIGDRAASRCRRFVRAGPGARPTTTIPLDQMSVEKCRASASSAWLSYLAAILPSARERQKSTAIEMNMHGKSGDAGLDLDVVEEQALGGFVDDPDTGQQEQASLDESGEVFDLAMSVLMVGVGRLVGDANRTSG